MCQEGSTPEAQEYELDDRTCLDASQVTSINIHRARGKTCSYWSEESDCLGQTVTVELSIKGGEQKVEPVSMHGSALKGIRLL